MNQSNILNSLKAISFGVITILILGLVNQVALIMATVGYNSLMKADPVFIPWSQVFIYSLGALGYFIVMATAGIVTTITSNQVIEKQAYINTIIAAVTGSSISLYLSLQQEFFTFLALFFILIGMAFAIFGGWVWKSKFEKLVN